MLEYVFFDERPRDGFIKYVADQGLEPVCELEEGVHKVLLPEDIPDELSELIEEQYDRMMALNRSLYEAEVAPDYQAAGITVQLKDGVSVYAQVPPQLLARIMETITPEEFNEVVNAIVEAVENPDTRSLCQRMRDQQAGNSWD